MLPFGTIQVITLLNQLHLMVCHFRSYSFRKKLSHFLFIEMNFDRYIFKLKFKAIVCFFPGFYAINDFPGFKSTSLYL